MQKQNSGIEMPPAGTYPIYRAFYHPEQRHDDGDICANLAPINGLVTFEEGSLLARVESLSPVRGERFNTVGDKVYDSRFDLAPQAEAGQWQVVEAETKKLALKLMRPESVGKPRLTSERPESMRLLLGRGRRSSAASWEEAFSNQAQEYTLITGYEAIKMIGPEKVLSAKDADKIYGTRREYYSYPPEFESRCYIRREVIEYAVEENKQGLGDWRLIFTGDYQLEELHEFFGEDRNCIPSFAPYSWNLGCDEGRWWDKPTSKPGYRLLNLRPQLLGLSRQEQEAVIHVRKWHGLKRAHETTVIEAALLLHADGWGERVMRDWVHCGPSTVFINTVTPSEARYAGVGEDQYGAMRFENIEPKKRESDHGVVLELEIEDPTFDWGYQRKAYDIKGTRRRPEL